MSVEPAASMLDLHKYSPHRTPLGPKRRSDDQTLGLPSGDTGLTPTAWIPLIRRLEAASIRARGELLDGQVALVVGTHSQCFSWDAQRVGMDGGHCAARRGVVAAPGVARAADENLTPDRTIAGVNTGLDRPFGGAFDSDGNLYIPSGESNSVLVFATADLTGTGNLNLTPVRTIKGGNTGLALPAGVAFDGNGDLYVAQQIGPVEVFAAADLVGTGELDLNPLRTIIVPSTGGGQLVFDDNGNLYVGAGFSVVAFSAVDLTGTGPSTPTPYAQSSATTLACRFRPVWPLMATGRSTWPTLTPNR